MPPIDQIDAQEAHNLLQCNPHTLLVCSYDDEEKFHQHDLEGAISFSHFTARKNSLSKTANIIFYCACPHDAAAIEKAQKLRDEGFADVRVLKGGFDAWKKAGFRVAVMV